MNSEKTRILEKNIREYFESGKSELDKSRYNSAAVLFFKCLVSSSDLFLILKTGESPSSHSDRFRRTKKDFPEIYDLIDKDFPFYQDSYSKELSKELSEVIMEDAKYVADKAGIKL